MDYEIPKFEVNMTKVKKKETSKNPSPDQRKHQKEEDEDWNNLERLSQLMVPKTLLKNARYHKLSVPNTKFHYTISLGNNQPEFHYMPSSIEIIQRLILRGAFAYGIHDFDL